MLGPDGIIVSGPSPLQHWAQRQNNNILNIKDLFADERTDTCRPLRPLPKNMQATLLRGYRRNKTAIQTSSKQHNHRIA